MELRINTQSLKNKRIVITRPSHQAKNLQTKLQAAGAEAILFPLLEITPPKDLAFIQKQLENIADYELVIFVSANAVEQTFKWIKVDSLKPIKIATTGKKTAATLTKLGIEIDFCPDQIFNSEALLAMPKFPLFCKDHKVVIIRGEGGRDLLKKSLLKIGAKVDYINAYQRSCPQKNLDFLKLQQRQSKLDVILLTSGSSVTNFFSLAKNEEWINDLTLLLGSPRMQKQIPSSFRGKLLIADDPSDETLYKKLIATHG